ncbi:MAG TPA: NrsF family protein [Candidatus Binataceae bacterium]|nr:NrsF family protein [Candidatus Binataceae bacterium]
MDERQTTPTTQYDLLIDRLIPDFQPVRTLLPVSARLALWFLLELAIIILLLLFRDSNDLLIQLHNFKYSLQILVFSLVGIAAANLALRTAIPGRELTYAELILTSAAVVLGVALFATEPLQTGASLAQFVHLGSSLVFYMISLAAVPWVVLFQLVRRGVPLRPGLSGGLVGAAAFSLALVAVRLASPLNDSLVLITWQIVPLALAVALSALAGSFWLNPAHIWRERSMFVDELVSPEARRATLVDRVWTHVWSTDVQSAGRAFFPVALSAAIILLAVFLRGQREIALAIPDFDLAIDGYGQSLVSFQSNVPTESLASVMKAYIEHGMPAYMWDFGPDGYKMVGGRVDTLADGSPITYTLYRGNAGAIFCVIRATDAFKPPAGVFAEHRHYFFYTYKGYSVCLNNIGNYGSYSCVLVSRLPMKQFMRAVLAVAP